MLGLRISETISLQLKDLNLCEKYLVIRESKFYKSRMVPFNDQVVLLLKDFLGWRKAQGWSSDNETFVFLDKNMDKLSIDVVRNAFERIRDLAGIKLTAPDTNRGSMT